MSYLFGAWDAPPDLVETLASQFAAIWPGSTPAVFRSGDGRLALYALQPGSFFPGEPVVFDRLRNRVFAIRGYVWADDGFPPDAEGARRALGAAGDRLIEHSELTLPSDWGGLYNLVAVDLSEGVVAVAGDPSGLLNLYYARLPGGGLLFTSHIRPLARVLRAAFDPVSLVQFAGFHHMIGPRTLFRGIRLMHAGESIVLRPRSGDMTHRQQSRAYGPIVEYGSDNEAADALWADYENGVIQLRKGPGARGVLLSGGFDSRLVAAGFSAGGKPVVGVTFGDDGNAEVGIARRVAEITGARSIVHTPVEDCHPGLDRIRGLIDRVESANFAYCETAARLLKEAGTVTAATGYGGETFLGGQAFVFLGAAWSTGQRFRRAAGRSLGFPARFRTPVSEGSLDALQLRIAAYFRRALDRAGARMARDWRDAVESARRGLDDEVRAEIQRIALNRPGAVEQICERFWLEHHVLKHFGYQERTMFSVLPLAMPTLHHEFYVRCSNLPPERKVDHGIYLAMVRRKFGPLSGLPTSNIPLPLRSPEIALWIARALRAGRDNRRVRRQMQTRDGGPRRFGWSNFETWLRQGPFLEDVAGWVDPGLFDAEHLRAELERMRRWEERVFSGQDLLTLVTASEMTREFL